MTPVIVTENEEVSYWYIQPPKSCNNMRNWWCDSSWSKSICKDLWYARKQSWEIWELFASFHNCLRYSSWFPLLKNILLGLVTDQQPLAYLRMLLFQLICEKSAFRFLSKIISNDSRSSFQPQTQFRKPLGDDHLRECYWTSFSTISRPHLQIKSDNDPLRNGEVCPLLSHRGTKEGDGCVKWSRVKIQWGYTIYNVLKPPQTKLQFIFDPFWYIWPLKYVSWRYRGQRSMTIFYYDYLTCHHWI